MKKGRLKCEVAEGMFKGERIVSLLNIEGNTISAIVNEESIIDDTFLEVDVYKEKKGKGVLIGIPGETFSTPRKIWVRKIEKIEK